jgi:hypothetical protein
MIFLVQKSKSLLSLADRGDGEKGVAVIQNTVTVITPYFTWVLIGGGF